jgi:hypothetical protein
MKLIEAESNIFYITGLTGNQRLNKNVEDKLNEAKNRYNTMSEKKTVKLYHSFDYTAGSWNTNRRVVAKIEYGNMGKNIRFVVSNLDNANSTELYEDIYCKRGGMELLIKEHKTYLKSSRTSCHSFFANQFRLFLHSAAYALIHSLQKEILKGTEFANSTMQTIQLKVLKIASRIKEMKTKINLFLPISYPYKTMLAKSFAIFYVLRN